MRNGRIGLLSAMVFASTTASAGCGSSGGEDADANPSTGGSLATGGSSGTGGAVGTGGGFSTGGTVGTGGSPSTGGSAGTGGSSDSGGRSVTTVSGTKALSELTATETTQLCSDTYVYYRDAVGPASLCQWQGLAYGVSSSAPTDAELQAN